MNDTGSRASRERLSRRQTQDSVSELTIPVPTPEERRAENVRANDRLIDLAEEKKLAEEASKLVQAAEIGHTANFDYTERFIVKDEKNNGVEDKPTNRSRRNSMHSSTSRVSNCSSFHRSWQDNASLSSGSFEGDFAAVGDFTEDRDLIHRIRSRASIRSDVQHMRELREKYKEGFFRLDPHDPRDPHTWSVCTRMVHSFMAGISVLLAYASGSIFAPVAVPLGQVAHHGTEVGTLTFCLFLLGTMVGPPLFLSVVGIFGRKVALYIPLFICGIVLCLNANVDGIAPIAIYRFLAGVVAAGPITCIQAASADLWLTPSSRGRAYEISAGWSFFCMILGSVGCPIFGALLVEVGSYGWRWCLWLVGLLNIVVGILSMLFLKETYLPIIEQRATRDKRIDSGFWGLHCEHDSFSFNIEGWKLSNARKLWYLLFNPGALICMTLTSYCFGIVYLLITAAPQEFQRYHPDMSTRASYCTLFAIAIGCLVCAPANIILARPRDMRNFLKTLHPTSSGVSQTDDKPERQLTATVLLGWLLPAGLFVFGWTMYNHIHWIGAVIGMSMVGGGCCVIIRGCYFYVMDVYLGDLHLLGLMFLVFRGLFAGVFPLFSRQLFNALKVHWGASLLAFIGLVLYAGPITFYLFAAKFR